MNLIKVIKSLFIPLVKNRLLIISALIIIWFIYPFIHIYKVKLSEDSIEYVIPSGYADDISELNKTKIKSKVILKPDLDAAIKQLDSLTKLAKMENISISIVGKKHSMGGQTINDNSLYDSMSNRNNPFGDGQAAEKIKNHLKNLNL